MVLEALVTILRIRYKMANLVELLIFIQIVSEDTDNKFFFRLPKMKNKEFVDLENVSM